MSKNNNPFSLSDKTSEKTNHLINNVLKGDKNALNQILIMHQDYIFNIALKMLNHKQDAEDITQEVLVKIVSNLAKFDSEKAKFTTWVYRITFNHILNYRKSEIEKRNLTFDGFFTFINNLPDEPITEQDDSLNGMSIDEARISCTAGMLMCLNREQRLTYIVGDIFKIDHNLAADIFEITPTNFRKKLSRARNDLHQWMHKKCGLVNKENPCRCKHKTKKFIELGVVDPKNYKWQSNFTKKISDLVEQNIQESLIERDEIYAKIHRDTPFKKNLKGKELYNEITRSTTFKKFIDPLQN